MRLRTRFLLLFLALSLAPLALVGMFATASGRRELEDSLGRLFELKAAQAIGALDHEIATFQGTGQAWAGLEWMQDVLNDDVDGRITTFLMQQVRDQPLLVAARVTNPNGVVVAASRPEWVGRAETSPPAGPEPACEDAVGDDDGRRPLLRCRYPIRAGFDERRVVGMLDISWDPAGLFRQVPLLPQHEAEPGELVLLRRDASVVLAPQRWQSWVLQRRLALRDLPATSPRAAGPSGYRLERIEDEEYLVGIGRSHGLSGWSALVLQDARTAFAPARHLRNLVLATGTLLALVVAALSVAVAGRLTGPLLSIEAAARRVAQGDLSVGLEARSRDELGSLATSFDRMVRELREQRAEHVDKQYLDSLLANMIDGLLVIDGGGRVERVNAALLALVGREEAEVVGGPAAALFAEGQEGLDATVLEPARRMGAAREVELHLVERGGARIPVSLSAGLLPSPGADSPAVVCITSDVRRRKAAERATIQAREAAEASAQAKDRFLATISHEIRTPLHGILGVVDLLEQRRLAPAPPEYAESLRHSADALLAVVNQVLDFSRLDTGKLELERREFDLRACLDGVIEILGPRARAKDLELVAAADPELPWRVVGDPARLRQVLLNLGSNAIAFTRRGEVVIRARRAAVGSSLIAFSVSDTGVGIPEAARPRLFQPFSQLDSSSTRAQGGTGLGLAICRHLVALMGGQIDFESEEGKGSTFRFTADLPPAQHAPASAAAASFSLAGLRVLVVDDNATNRFVAREMLAGWGASVAEASDGWDALEQLRARGEPFDLALVDFQMPEMDGGQLAARIREDPGLAGLPLVLLTSVPLHGDAVRMMKLGFDAYLTKPVRQAALRDAIAAVIGARRATVGAARLTLVASRPVSEPKPRVLLLAGDPATTRHTREACETAGCSVRVAGDAAAALDACGEESFELVLVTASGLDAVRPMRERRQAGGPPAIVLIRDPAAAEAPVAGADLEAVLSAPVAPDDVRSVLSRLARPGPQAAAED